MAVEALPMPFQLSQMAAEAPPIAVQAPPMAVQASPMTVQVSPMAAETSATAVEASAIAGEAVIRGNSMTSLVMPQSLPQLLFVMCPRSPPPLRNTKWERIVAT